MGESDDASDQGPDTPEGRETDAAGERTPTRYPSSDEGISDNVYSASFDVALRNAIEDGYTAARSLIQRVAAAARNAVLPARRPGRAASVRRRPGLLALGIAPELAHTQVLDLRGRILRDIHRLATEPDGPPSHPGRQELMDHLEVLQLAATTASLARFRLGPRRYRLRHRWLNGSLVPPVRLIPVALAVVADVAEHLEIGLVERQLRVRAPRLDVVDVDDRLAVGPRSAAALAARTARLDDLHT